MAEFDQLNLSSDHFLVSLIGLFQQNVKIYSGIFDKIRLKPNLIRLRNYFPQFGLMGH